MIQRNTHQRDSIRAVIEAADRPLSPVEILAGAKRKIPRLGMATVYRTVKELVESNWLRVVELPGDPPRYELSEKVHHHHFYCRSCNKAYDIPGCPGDLRALLPEGFEMQDHEVVFYGRCAACTQDDSKGKRSPRAAVTPHVHGAHCGHDTSPLAPPQGADGLGRGKGFGRELVAVEVKKAD